MRDDVTMYRRLSLAERMHRKIPTFYKRWNRHESGDNGRTARVIWYEPFTDEMALEKENIFLQYVPFRGIDQT